MPLVFVSVMVFKDMILYEQKRLSSLDCGECVAIIMSRMSLYSLFLHKTILVVAGNRQQTNERYAHDTNILFHDDLIFNDLRFQDLRFLSILREVISG